jgi:RNA polymerase sigma-70 factor, ECF subfamily
MGTAVKTLLQQAREGDIEAFAALFEPLRKKMHAVAYRLVGPTDAEDVVMETFLKAWKALPGFMGMASLSTWLCRIAHNVAMDFVRKRHTQEKRFVSEDDAGIPLEARADPSQTAADVAVMRRETREHLRGALARLPEPHRTVLLLRYADGLQYAEISAATGVSIGTVMSRIFNAKRKLKAVWSQLTDTPASAKEAVDEALS